MVRLMMKMFKYLMIFSGLLLYSVAARAQVPSGANWHLVKEGNGIQVYTAPAPSGLKYIKVKAELKGTLDKVSAVFRNIARQKDWVYGTRKSYLVKKIDDNNLLYYNETGLPWPVNNRDIAVRMKLKEAPAQGTLTISQEEVKGAVPVNKGIVRVPHMSGNWLFRDASKGQLHAEYYLDIDPGGSLPAWVVNMFVAKGPYQTFVKLQKMINQ
jgi:hypothetical protein